MTHEEMGKKTSGVINKNMDGVGGRKVIINKGNEWRSRKSEVQECSRNHIL